MDSLKNARQKLLDKQLEIQKKLEAIELNKHWFRRVFHTFAASFLLYYILPNEPWINIVKISIATLIVVSVGLLEYQRLKGKIESSNFFGLRIYEKSRPASYFYFGTALLILLLFFPQQIAIPCILCACFADPIIGEIRHRWGIYQAYVIGFLVCLLFFIITWLQGDLRIMIVVSLLGATGAIIGETRKVWLLDDDFLIQMLPALLILALWLGMTALGVEILPEITIHPV